MKNKEPKPLSQILKESAVRALWLVVIVFIVYLLQGCGNKRLASVEERQTNKAQVAANDNDDFSAAVSYTHLTLPTIYSV